MSHLELTPDRPPDEAADERRLDDASAAHPESGEHQPGERPEDERPEAGDVSGAGAERLDRLQVERAADEGMTGPTAPAAVGYDPDRDDDEEAP